VGGFSLEAVAEFKTELSEVEWVQFTLYPEVQLLALVSTLA
jgi:hypothetical protein